MQTERFIVACLQTAMKGELELGARGVVVVENELIGYARVDALAPAAFRERLAEMVDEDDGRHVFVVHKTALDLHVSKIPKPFVN